MRSTDSIQKNKLLPKLDVLLLVACCTIFLSPYLSRNLSSTIQAIVTSMWLFVMFKNSLHIRYKTADIFLILAILLYQSIETLYKIFEVSSAEWGNYYTRYIFFFLLIAMIYIQYEFSEQQKRELAWFVFCIISINLLDNIRLNYIYPNASVEINNSWGNAYLNMNVGATLYCAASMLFLGLSLIISINSRITKIRIFASLVTASSIALVIYFAQRATTILLAIFMIVIILIIRYIKSKKLKYSLLLLFSLGCLFEIFTDFSFLRHIFIAGIGSRRLTERYISLINFFDGSLDIYSQNGTLSTRLDLLMLSVSTFLRNFSTFLFGIGYHKFAEHVSNAFSTGIGQHSELIDNLAKNGIVGGFIVAFILKKCYDIIKKNTCQYAYGKQLVVVYLIFVVYSFLNNSFQPMMGIVVFILLPLIPYMIESIRKTE